MDNKKTFNVAWLMEAILVLFLVGIGAFLFYESVNHYEDSELSKYYYIELNTGWNLYVNGDHRGVIDLPFTLQDTVKEDEVYIESRIPTVLKGGFYISTRISRQNLAFYIGNETDPRGAFVQSDQGVYRENIVGRYIYQSLRLDDAGETVRIVGSANNNGVRYFMPVYVGDKAGIISKYLKDNVLSMSFALFYFFLGSLCVVGGIILKFVFHNVFRIDQLGWALILVTVWDITQSDFRDLLFVNFKAISIVPAFALMALPIPLTLFINSIQKGRYASGYSVVTLVALVHAIIKTALQFSGTHDVFYNFFFVFVILFGLVAFSMWTFHMDRKAGLLEEYKIVSWGFYALSISGFAQMIYFYVSPTKPDGIFLCSGFAVMMLFAMAQVSQLKVWETGVKKANEMATDLKVQFLANMSHEIRTPINAMLGMNEAILRESLEDNIQGYAADIDEAGHYLLTLINDILDYSKLDTGKSELVLNEYSLKSLIINSVNYVGKLAKDKGLNIGVNVDGKLPSSFYGDEVRIQQIICNLLNNAVKYTDNGSVMLNVFGETIGEEKYNLHFEVVDTGRGISEEDLGRLFYVFNKFDGKGSANEGSGLGLAISDKLAGLMNGSIKAESTLGVGSRFILTIPQQVIDREPVGIIDKQNMEEHAQKRADVDLFRASDCRILVVDDNLMNRRLVTVLLARTGLKIDCAATGDEGITLACKNRYDVIFMDHVMPVKDGVETLNELKNTPGNLNPETPVVMLTANAILGARESYLEAGFTDYLSKPFRSEDIQKLLLKYLPEEQVTRLYSRSEY